MAKKIFWTGNAPKNCQLEDGHHIDSTFYDANVGGRWGLICPKCFKANRLRTGVGQAQKFVRQPDGRFMKTEG